MHARHGTLRGASACFDAAGVPGLVRGNCFGSAETAGAAPATAEFISRVPPGRTTPRPSQRPEPSRASSVHCVNGQEKCVGAVAGLAGGACAQGRTQWHGHLTGN